MCCNRGNKSISQESESEVTCGQVWWPIHGISALHLTHLSAHTHREHTHTVNTHLEQWAANAAAPGEQLGVRCLAQGSHLSRGIEGGKSAGHSLPPPTIPAGPDTQTRDLQVTSPTVYPLGHYCPKMERFTDLRVILSQGPCESSLYRVSVSVSNSINRL